MIHILVEDLSFRYQGTQRLALDGINIEITPGEFVLITGPSGCGKSTLVDCLNGLIPHRYKGFVKGTVYIDGKDWFDIDYNKMSVRIGLVRQDAESQLACMDVESEIAYGPKNLCLTLSEIEERVDWALKVVSATHLKTRRINTLSGGEKQKVAIASMLSMKPEILILDEPSSFVDISGIQELFASLYMMRKLNPNMTLIVVDHELFYVLPIIERLIIMSDSKIMMDGNPQLLISEKYQEIEKFGVRIHPALLLYYQHFQRNELQILDKKPSEAYFDLNKLLFEHLDKFWQNHSKDNLIKTPLLELTNVSYSYNHSVLHLNKKQDKEKSQKYALEDINLTINKGDFLCIMGNNGSGKTTLLQLLARQLEPTSGIIKYKQEELVLLKKTDFAKEIGLIFQNPEHQFFKKTVEEELLYGPENFGIDTEKLSNYKLKLMEYLNLSKYPQKLPFSLSWGEKRRLNIASILLHLPNLP